MPEEIEQLTRLVEEQARENDLALDRIESLEALVQQNVADIIGTNDRFPREADTRDIVLQGHPHPRFPQVGKGTPTHVAREGTLYWDKTNNVLLANSDGSTGWTEMDSAAHTQSHDMDSHATVAQISDVRSFVGTIDGVIISAGGTLNLPAAPFGLILVVGQGFGDDDLDDILTNGGSTTLVPGTKIWLTGFVGTSITIKHSTKIVLSRGADVVLSTVATDIICLQAISSSQWYEVWRSPSLLPFARPYTYSITFGWDSQSPQVFAP